VKIELTKEETENLILVALDDLQQNSYYSENGVKIETLAKAVNMELGDLKKYIQELKLKNEANWNFEQKSGGEFYISITEQTIEKLKKLNALTINEIATLLLKKSYEIYQRANYDSYFQFDSTFIGAIIGINNIPKIRSAIEMLNNRMLISNPAIMTDNIIYLISPEGIDMIENGDKKQMPANSVIVNNIGGNVAVNSDNARQSVSNNELEGYFSTLEKLIEENLKDDVKSNALNDVELIRELVKVEPPKKPLIMKVLDRLEKIPVLIEIIKTIGGFIGLK
jgi:predicted transcriptional regulator